MPLFSQSLLAQATNGGSGLGVWVIILFCLIAVILLVADNLVGAQATMHNVKLNKDDSSFFPSLTNFLSKEMPSYVTEGTMTTLKKGFDLRIEGNAGAVIKDVAVSTFAIQPGNFRGIAPIPKMMIAVGDEVKAGDPLFYDKSNEEVKYVAPVSGEIIGINRGAKRCISEVVILADKEKSFRELPVIDLKNTNRTDLINYLKSNGFLPHINQRPFDLIPNGESFPRDIYISTFDTAPLAPDLNLIVKGKKDFFQKGLDTLALLTDGDVHLGLSANGNDVPAAAYSEAKGVKKHWFRGIHPTGNVGIQMSHVAPINSGDMVWTLNVQDVILLGEMISEGRYNPTRIIAVTGSGVSNPIHVRTSLGAQIGDILKNNLVDDSHRIISGDVLSGDKKELTGFLNVKDDQITVIPEGNYAELFGWLVPSKVRPSVSKTFLSGKWKDTKYEIDTNTHGEKRAFVITGQYESVLPMNTFPQHLMKAIMVKDFEKMEGLGIYELSEEDLALCEFACTSKMPLQKILREGLDFMQEQQ